MGVPPTITGVPQVLVTNDDEASELSGVGKPDNLDLVVTVHKMETNPVKKRTPPGTPERDGKKSASSSPYRSPSTMSSSTNRRSPLDLISIATIPGAKGASGLGVFFENSPYKMKQSTSPYASKAMLDMVKNEYKFCNIFTFAKRSFDMETLNEPPVMYTYYSRHEHVNRTTYNRVFIVVGVDPASITKQQYKQIAVMICDEINKEHGKDLAESDDNFLVKDKYKVWSDLFGHQNAHEVLKFHCTDFRPRKISDGFPAQDEPTWGKANLHIISTFYRKGTLTPSQCAIYGLGREWSQPVPAKTQEGLRHDDLVDSEDEGEGHQKKAAF